MYIRPTLETLNFVNVGNGRNAAFYIIKSDLQNRRVALIYGRIGTAGVTKVHTFATRDDAREFVEEQMAKRADRGYRAVETIAA